MSEETKQQIMRFVEELKVSSHKISWDEIASRVKEKFPGAEAGSLTSNAIRKRFNNWLKERGDPRTLEPSQLSDTKKEGVETMFATMKEQLHEELMLGMEDYVEEYVKGVIERVSTEIAERVFQEKVSYLPNVQTVGSVEPQGHPTAPPLPETVTGTRRHTVQRGKLAGTVDSALLELFESERRERGYNVSRMLDVILWNYFGIGRPEKPKLSFELSETSPSQE